MKNRSRFADESDMALVNMVKGGDQDAFGELWRRHSGAIAAAARSFTGFDPEDVSQETFTRILRALQTGKGPNTAFRAYAIMTARNVAANMARNRGSEDITGASEETLEALSEPQDDFAPQLLEGSFTLSVFRSLPVRWQEALWYREVEDLPVQVFCTFLGMSENATSALLKRAREGFKQAWIAANLSPSSGLEPDCKWVIERLPRYIRGRSTAAVRKKLESHVSTCPRCAIVVEESESIHSRLALVLLPAFLGGPAGLAYLDWTRSAGHSDARSGPLVSGPPGRAMRMAKIGLLPAAVVLAGSLGGAYAFGTFSDHRHPSGTVPTAPHDAPRPQAAASPAEGQSNRHASGGTNRVPRGTTPSEDRTPAAFEGPPGTSGEPRPRPPRDSTPNPSPSPSPSPSPNPSPAPSPAPTPPATPIRIPPTLTAAPVDGAETGVYPRLLGTGVPGAVIALQVSNENGEHLLAETRVAADGTWRFTPSTLHGTLTVTAAQRYTKDGRTYSETPVVLGPFQVGDGLRMTITATSATESTLRITGFGTPSKNQVGNAKSSLLGALVVKQAPNAVGEVVVVLPYARSALGEVRFWQGDTSTGPYRVWRLAQQTAP